MNRTRRFGLLIGLGLGTLARAQTAEDRLLSEIAKVHYPRLAEAARVQGNVLARTDSGRMTILSGPTLFKSLVQTNAATIEAILGRSRLEFMYHFALPQPEMKRIRVESGNVFERALLRLVGIKTEKIVTVYDCDSPPAEPNQIRVSEDHVEIWIFGRTRCVMPEATIVAALRR